MKSTWENATEILLIVIEKNVELHKEIKSGNNITENLGILQKNLYEGKQISE